MAYSFYYKKCITQIYKYIKCITKMYASFIIIINKMEIL